jgi:hypothetical protein
MSRRIDWRFLLDDPTLGVVAYVGHDGGSLLAALRLFSDEVSVVGPQAFADDSQGSRYDGVVLSHASRAVLRYAVGLLKPGGWVYAEVSRFRSPVGSRAYAAAARDAGLDAVALHWHWPDFERSTVIVPLDDAGALAYFGQRTLSRVPARASGGVIRMLERTGLLALGVPYFSLVGRRR